MRLTSKEIILFGLLGALMALGQISLNIIPNIEVVSLFVIIFTLVYGVKSLYSVGIFVAIMGLIYGFGTWWLGYLVIWPSLGLLTLLLKRFIEGNYLVLSLFSGAFGLIFGALYAIPYIFVVDVNYAITYWIRGLPYDFIHMVGNYFTMLFLGKVLYELLLKLNKNYFR